jgi:hypothetical protein
MVFGLTRRREGAKVSAGEFFCAFCAFLRLNGLVVWWFGFEK